MMSDRFRLAAVLAAASAFLVGCSRDCRDAQGAAIACAHGGSGGGHIGGSDSGGDAGVSRGGFGGEGGAHGGGGE